MQQKQAQTGEITICDVSLPSSRHRLSPCRSKPSPARRVSREEKSRSCLMSGCRSAAPESSQWGTGTAGLLRRKRMKGKAKKKSVLITTTLTLHQCTSGEICGDGRCGVSSPSFGPQLHRVHGSRMKSTQIILC